MEQQNQNIIHSIETPKSPAGKSPIMAIIIFLIVIAAGIGTGYGVKTLMTNTGGQKSTTSTTTSTKKETVVQSAGIKDEKTFSDKAEGVLREGGIEGEGAFHLERPGGKDQTAYLTSTTVDLEPYIGKKVRVLGKTFAGKKAGWLMDVGYVEVLQ